MPRGPKLAVIQRYHQMLCQMRGPQEWSRNPRPAVRSKRCAPHLDDARDRHVLFRVAAREVVRRPWRRHLALVPLALIAVALFSQWT